MRHSSMLATAVLGAAATVPFVGVGAAAAADGSTMANLRPVALNGVKGSGTAMVEVHGTRITRRDVDREAALLQRRYEQMLKGITLPKMPDLRSQALDNLIDDQIPLPTN